MKAFVSIITLTIVLITSSYFIDTAFATEEHHSHDSEEHHVHDSKISTITTLVGVASLITSLLIISRIIPTGKRLESYLVLLLSFGAGIIHILLGPTHYTQVGVEHGIFFFAIGTYQIMFGILYFISKRMTKITIVILIGNIILYAITRIEGITEPFVAPEGIDMTGVITKIIEASLVAVLIKQIVLEKHIVLKKEKSGVMV